MTANWKSFDATLAHVVPLDSPLPHVQHRSGGSQVALNPITERLALVL